MNVQQNKGFTRGQRLGVLALVLFIFSFLGISAWWQQKVFQETPFSEKENKAVMALQHRIDSVKRQKLRQQPAKIYPFNPNFISDYKGYTLGMSPSEIDRLHNFRKKDQWVNSAEDFQKVTQVSDALLKKISPYFKFPEWVIEKKHQEHLVGKKRHNIISETQKADLNKVTAQALQKISGVGSVLAHRIIRYRLKLHNFVDAIQLKDVYGVDFETRKRILSKFTVKNKRGINKVGLNTGSVLELSKNIEPEFPKKEEQNEFVILWCEL